MMTVADAAGGGVQVAASRSVSRYRRASIGLVGALVGILFGMVFAGAAFGVRGHEFGFVVGWGVAADGEARLETCTKECRPGLPGSGKGQFSKPLEVAVDEVSGDFYVVDEVNARVEKFGAEGEYLGTFDGSGTFEVLREGKVVEETGGKPPTGKLLQPKSIAVDNSCVQSKLSGSECKERDESAGDVYVADFGNEAIDKFTADGEYLGQTSVPRVENGLSLEILGLAVDKHGNLWVAEQQGLNHIGFDEFDDGEPNGFFEFHPLSGGASFFFQGPHPGLVIGSEGNLFADTSFEKPFDEVIRKFAPDGAIQGVLRREKSTGLGGEWTSGELYVDNGLSVGRFTPDTPAAEMERFGSGHLTGGAGLAVNATVVRGTPVREGPVVVADEAAADAVVFPLEVPKPPTVQDVSVSGVTADSVTLRGTVNPRGAPSEYRLEYGECSTTAECQSSGYEVVPSGKGTVGASLDFEAHQLSVHLQALQSGSAYHFRLAAHNIENAPGEFVDSEEVVFRTQPAIPVERLLDRRDWEMVSPPLKHGTLIESIGGQDVIQAAAGGQAFAFVTDTPTEAEPKGSSNIAQILARRMSTGWVSEDIGLSHSRATGQSIGQGGEYRFFSEDLSTALVQPFGQFEQATSPEATEQTPYLRNDFSGEDPQTPCAVSCYRPLVTEGNAPTGTRFGEEGLCPPRLICGPVVVGATPDGRHVILRSSVGLSALATDHGGLYEWSDGILLPVSVTPSGVPASPASGPTLGGNGTTRGAVSSDGSIVVWTGSSGKSLFMRNLVAEATVELNAGIAGTPVFQTASVDDSRVFFTDGSGDLYVYEAQAGKAVRLTTPVEAGEQTQVQGHIAGISEDGTSVYFVANGRLSEGMEGGAGTCEGDGSNEANRCYLYHLLYIGGAWAAPQLIAVLSGFDAPDFAHEPAHSTTRVSSDGRWLAFMSSRPLTGYDNRDAVSGIPDEEVFVYDSTSSQLVCVSCNPTGARPDGVEASQIGHGLVVGVGVWRDPAWLAANVPGWTPYALAATFYQSRYLLDDGRVFFNSSDALVPGDVDGTEDVYEYEPEGVGSCARASLTYVEASGGCVALLSSGTSRQESAFLDASASGSDVFLLTASQLSRSDSDTAADVYDAHECSAASPCLPEPPAEQLVCLTEAACKPPPALEHEIFSAPASATFSGLGNIPPAQAGTRSSTSSRKRALAKALSRCKRRYRRRSSRRVPCERHARALFAATNRTTGRHVVRH